MLTVLSDEGKGSLTDTSRSLPEVEAKVSFFSGAREVHDALSSFSAVTGAAVDAGSVDSAPLADRKHSCTKCAGLGQSWCPCFMVNHKSTPAAATSSNYASGGSREATEA